MKLFKVLGILLVYLVAIFTYLTTGLYRNFNENFIISILIIIMLLIVTVKYGMDILRKGERNKFKIIRGITNVLCIGLVGISLLASFICYEYQDKKIPFGIAWFKYTAEPLDYNEKFETTIYKNNKINHTKNQELILGLMKSYIDEAIEINKGIFGDFKSSQLTIKADYNREVFDKRAGTDNLAGYYMIEEKAMYISIEDIYDDFISGVRFIKDDKTGEDILLDYKKTFLHEYTHHITYEFLKSNKIQGTDIPTWFNEGISDYVANKGRANFFVSSIDEIKKFSEIETASQWQEESGKKGNTVYLQSYFAVDMIVKENGEEVIKEIIIKSKEHGFNKAFEIVTGKSLEKFENELEEDVKNQFGKYFSYEIIRNDDNNNEKVEAETLEKYLVSNEKNIDAYIRLYLIYINDLDNEKRAIEVLEDGALKNPTNLEILQQLKTAYEYTGEEKKVREIQKVIKSL